MDLSSPVTWARRRPRSLTKIIDCGPMTPDVLMATGVNVCEESRWAYLVFFLSSANAATAPASLVALATYEGAKVSGQVASQTNNLPLFHGTTVMPSGRFPSVR